MKVDASWSQHSKIAGVASNNGFNAAFKCKSSLYAELFAIYAALRLGADKVETDCLTAVRAIKRKRLIRRHESICKMIYYTIGKRKVAWIRRTKNIEADALARKARKENKILTISKICSMLKVRRQEMRCVMKTIAQTIQEIDDAEQREHIAILESKGKIVNLGNLKLQYTFKDGSVLVL